VCRCRFTVIVLLPTVWALDSHSRWTNLKGSRQGPPDPRQASDAVPASHLRADHLHRMRPVGRAEAMIDRSEEGCEGVISTRPRLDLGGGVGRARWWWRLRDPDQGPSERLGAGRLGGHARVGAAGGDGAAGPVQDQPSLHDLLYRIQSLGLELVEIRRLPAAADEVPTKLEHQPPDF